MPPCSSVITPAWTAAVQTDESPVYVPLPHTRWMLPPGGHTKVTRSPTAGGRIVPFVAHVIGSAGGSSRSAVLASADRIAKLSPHSPYAMLVTPFRVLA